MSQTTPSQFAQAISLIKSNGIYEDGIWTYLKYDLSNDVIDLGRNSSMVGYRILDRDSNLVATMTWEDIVTDPDGIIAPIIA